MTSEKPSASAFKVQILIGTWWFPGSDQHWYGTLTFDITGEQSLKIISESEELSLTLDNSPKIFHGKCVVDGSLKCVTVFHALHIHSLSYENDQNTLFQDIFNVDDIWISNVHYQTWEDVKFTSFSFKMHNLEYWLNEKNVFETQSNDETISAAMRRVPVIKLFENETVEIEINYSYNHPHRETAQLAATISYCPEIKIISKNGDLAFYGQGNSFEYYWQCAYDFICLCLGGYTYFFDMDGCKSGSEKVYSTVLFSHDITAKQRKSIDLVQIIFPYCEVKNDLQTILNNFFSRYTDIKHICSALITCLYTSRYMPYVLSNLLYGLEGLQQAFYPELDDSNNVAHSPEKDQFLQKANKIIALCPPELKQFAKNNLEKKVPYYKRVQGMISDVTVFFPFLTSKGCIRKLAYEIGQMRIESAHFKKRNQPCVTNIIFMIFFVQYLQLAIIMKALGLSEDRIKKCYLNKAIGDLCSLSGLFQQYHFSHGDEQ